MIRRGRSRVYRPNSIYRVLQVNNAVRSARDQDGNPIYFPANINDRLVDEIVNQEQREMNRNIIHLIQRAQADALAYQQLQDQNNIPQNWQRDFHPNQRHMDRYNYRQQLMGEARQRALNENQRRQRERINRDAAIFNEYMGYPAGLMRNYGVPLPVPPLPGYVMSPEHDIEIAAQVPLPISSSSSRYSSSRRSSPRHFPSLHSSSRKKSSSSSIGNPPPSLRSKLSSRKSSKKSSGSRRSSGSRKSSRRSSGSKRSSGSSIEEQPDTNMSRLMRDLKMQSELDLSLIHI